MARTVDELKSYVNNSVVLTMTLTIGGVTVIVPLDTTFWELRLLMSPIADIEPNDIAFSVNSLLMGNDRYNDTLLTDLGINDGTSLGVSSIRQIRGY